MNVYVYKGNERQGPYDEAEVDKGLKSGLYKPTDRACREGMNTWQPLEKLFPVYGLDRLISHALKIIGISTLLAILLVLAASSYVGRDYSFQMTQAVIVFLLHLLCLLFLYRASKSHDVNPAIYGMLPGSLWNLGILLYAVLYIFDKHARSAGSLGVLVLTNYWWLSNLIRLVKFRKILAADIERKGVRASAREMKLTEEAG